MTSNETEKLGYDVGQVRPVISIGLPLKKVVFYHWKIFVNDRHAIKSHFEGFFTCHFSNYFK